MRKLFCGKRVVKWNWWILLATQRGNQWCHWKPNEIRFYIQSERKRKAGTSQTDYGKQNKIHVINDTDKKLGPANADKSDVINECKRQLFDVLTYSKLSKTEMESFLSKSIEKHQMVVKNFTLLHYSSGIFWRKFIPTLIPFSMTAWVWLNF